MTNRLWNEDRRKLQILLKELRKEKAGLTQVQLGKILDKPQSYVSKYESGERKLDYIEVREICKALNISMQRFDQLYDDLGKNYKI